MKNWFAVLLLFVAAFVAIPGELEAAAQEVKLYLDGQQLSPEVPPRIVEGNTLVPVRLISEKLGAEVKWVPDERRVDIRKSDKLIVMRIDNRVVTVNGNSVELVVAPTIVDGSTLVPVRFVAETFGLKVEWDGPNYAVRLSTVSPTALPSPAASPALSPTPTPSPTPAVSAKPAGSPSPGTSAKPSQSSSPTPSVTAPSVTSLPYPSGNPGASVESIRFVGTRLVIEAKGALQETVFYLKKPDRVIVDLPGSRLGAALSGQAVNNQGEIAIQSDLVTKIRYAQHADKVRIVLETKSNVKLSKAEGVTANVIAFDVKQPRYVVVVDAGHGGKDPGALSLHGMQEKEFTLAVAKKVYELLSAEPMVNVLMTRTRDTYPSLDERVAMANNANADLFISIHANKYNGKTHGTETYYYHERSRPFAEEVHRRVLEATGFADRSVRQNDFRVITYTNMPSVLLEVGYLDHPANEEYLLKDEFRGRVAAAIVAAIKNVLKLS